LSSVSSDKDNSASCSNPSSLRARDFAPRAKAFTRNAGNHPVSRIDNNGSSVSAASVCALMSTRSRAANKHCKRHSISDRPGPVHISTWVAAILRDLDKVYIIASIIATADPATLEPLQALSSASFYINTLRAHTHRRTISRLLRNHASIHPSDQHHFDLPVATQEAQHLSSQVTYEKKSIGVAVAEC
jgi:hypothetical protein